MATVGLSFGSATSGAGFDVTSTVTSILAIESGVEAPWKAQVTSLKAQDSALTTLGTNLSALSTALGSLTHFDGVLAAKQGASSDTNVLSLTSASPASVAGSHSIVVNSLASTSSAYSDRVGAADVLSGSLTLQVGSAAAQTISLPGGGGTLAQLAASINNGSYGVTASVVTDTQGARLSLVSSTSGTAGQITLTPSVTNTATGTNVAFTQGQAGADASLTVDGLATTSASNTVTNVIPGVTFQLLGSQPGKTVQVQITNDNSSVESAVQSLVTAYNAVVANVKTQEGKDATGAAEPLFGDPTLALVQSALSTGLLGGAPSGSIRNLAQLGLSVNPDGTLTLEASTLEGALNAHFTDVTGFLQNQGSFGQTLTTTLNGLSATGSKGAIYLALQQNASVESSLNADVTKEEARIAIDKTKLTAELNTANQILQSIPSQLNQVNEIYSALTGYNTSR